MPLTTFFFAQCVFITGAEAFVNIKNPISAPANSFLTSRRTKLLLLPSGRKDKKTEPRNPSVAPDRIAAARNVFNQDPSLHVAGQILRESIDCQNFNNAVRNLFLKRSQENDFLTPESLRLALKDVRIEETIEEVKELTRQYDHENTGIITSDQFCTIMGDLPTARFWLTVDREGGKRKLLNNLTKLSSAGLASSARKAHSYSGVVSMIVGLLDFARVATFGMTDALPAETAQLIGAIHCFCAATAFLRFEWGGFPFEGHQPARRNLLVGAVLTALYCFGLLFIEFGSPLSDQVLLPVQSVHFQVFAGTGYLTALCTALASSVEGGTKKKRSGLLGDSRLENFLASGLPLVSSSAPGLFYAAQLTDASTLDAYRYLCKLHPLWIPFLQNSSNFFLFTNNFLSLLSTAIHYDIISKSQLDVLNKALSTVYLAWVMQVFCFGLGDGFVSGWMDLFF